MAGEERERGAADVNGSLKIVSHIPTMKHSQPETLGTMLRARPLRDLTQDTAAITEMLVLDSLEAISRSAGLIEKTDLRLAAAGWTGN